MEKMQCKYRVSYFYGAADFRYLSEALNAFWLLCLAEGYDVSRANISRQLHYVDSVTVGTVSIKVVYNADRN